MESRLSRVCLPHNSSLQMLMTQQVVTDSCRRSGSVAGQAGVAAPFRSRAGQTVARVNSEAMDVWSKRKMWSHFQLPPLSVTDSTADQQNHINQLPDVAPTESNQLQDADSDVSRVNPMDAVDTKERQQDAQ